MKVLIKSKITGKYFKKPGKGVTKHRKKAHAYDIKEALREHGWSLTPRPRLLRLVYVWEKTQ